MTNTVVAMGEVLWDIFGEEKKIGGATFNFSAHLAGLGEHVLLITGVGRDELGREAQRRMAAHGIDARYAREVDWPTGACHVTLGEDGTPQYDLLDHIAYDHPALTDADIADIRALNAGAFYFGTLAQRDPDAHEKLCALLDACAFPTVFLDINIRKPFISREVLEFSLQRCTLLKVSREEYRLLTEMKLVEGVDEGDGFEESLCRALAKRYPAIQAVLVTRDKAGAMAYDARSDGFVYSIRPTSKLVSAVGAGDSFSAAFLHAYLAGHPLTECLNRGVLLSDYVVTQLGAVPDCPPELRAKIV